MSGGEVRKPVFLSKYLLSPRKRKQRELEALREELERRRREGASRWIIEWYEREIRRVEEELREMG